MRYSPLILLAGFLVGCGGAESETPIAESGPPESPQAAAAETTASSADKPEAKPAGDTLSDQLVKKARAAVVANRPRVAVESLSQAIGHDSSNSQLFRLRADVYAMLGEHANAQADFALAVANDPDNAELRNVRGYFLMTNGAAAEALADFNKAIELDENLALAWNNRGLVFLSAGKFKEAESDFDAAVTRDEKYADAWNNRGFARMKQEQFETALKDFDKALEIKPEYATAWNNRGLTCMHQKDFDAAVSAFSKAVECAPTDIRWLNHRRAALAELGRYDEATRDADRIRWLTTLDQLTREAFRTANNPTGWFRRAEHLCRGSQYGAAVQDFSRAIALKPGNAEALAGRAYAWSKTGDYKKAIADCDESLILKPDAATYSIRGDAWMALENYEQAVEDLKASNRFDESMAEAYELRAAQRKKDGKTDLAQEDLTAATNIRRALNGELKTADAKPPEFPSEGE